MNVQYINPFIKATQSVFSTMLGCQITRNGLSSSGSHPKYDISGIIGLSGKAKGTLVLSMSEVAALKAASALHLEEQTEFNSDVVDAIGELTNMIAGGAKAEVAHLKLRITIPTVIMGKDHVIEFPSNVTPVTINFTSEWGPLAVEFGLIEVPEETTVSG